MTCLLMLLCAFRTILLLLLAGARGVGWIVEQPLTSVFFAASLWQEFLEQIGAWWKTFSLKLFGAETEKKVMFMT